jgi:nucleotide-binding universal stress UspA family protein
VKAVVGVDGSEASEGALRWAVEEARLHQGQVVAIHAWEAPVPPVDLLPTPHPDFVALVSELRGRRSSSLPARSCPVLVHRRFRRE